MKSSRREFLQRSAAAGALLSSPYVWSSRLAQAQQAGNRPKLAAIGVGGSRGAYSQGGAIARRAAQHGRHGRRLRRR